MDAALTDDQAAVYDRQLRVWGVEVQRKLTAARVLLVGFGQLAAEVAKNITLAGVGHVTLLDDAPAKQHAGRNFLISTADAASEQTAAQAAAKNLQAMNPLVKVSCSPGSPKASSSWAPQLLQQQDLVIAAGPGLPLLQLQQLDAACRQAGVGFMAAAAAGPAGWFFVDMGRHSYRPKGGGGSADERVLQFSSLAAALGSPAEQPGSRTHPLYHVLQACLATEQRLQRQLGADDLAAAEQQLSSSSSDADGGREVVQQLLAAAVTGAEEFAPVCAVLGGIIANNVVTAESGSAAPLNNMLYFTLFDGRAIVETRPAAAAGEVGAAAAEGKATAAGGAVQQVEEVLID